MFRSPATSVQPLPRTVESARLKESVKVTGPGVGEGVTVGVLVGVAVALKEVGVRVGVTVGVAVGVLVGVCVGLGGDVGVRVGVGVTVFVAAAVAVPVGVPGGVGVAVPDGVRVAVLEGVGVLVPVGVRVTVGPTGVAVGVFVRVLVGVTVAVGCAVGVGGPPRVTDTTAEPLLFPIRGSGSLPITPTTAVSVPCESGTTRITRLLSPAAAQMTVVDNSADAVFATQRPAGTDESRVTLGRNTTVSVTLASPLEPPIPALKAAAVPTVALPGADRLTDRSLSD
jgi:hypothetical protein